MKSSWLSRAGDDPPRPPHSTRGIDLGTAIADGRLRCPCPSWGALAGSDDLRTPDRGQTESDPRNALDEGLNLLILDEAR